MVMENKLDEVKKLKQNKKFKEHMIETANLNSSKK